MKSIVSALFLLSLYCLVVDVGSLFAQQPTIQSVQAGFDPPDGQPQNARITVLVSTVLPPSATLQIALRTIAADGTSKPIDPPAAIPLRDNPTGVFFLVPVTKLAGTDQLAYQTTLKLGDQSQTTPELRFSLAPIGTFQQLAQQVSTLQTQLNSARQQRDAALQAYIGGLPDAPSFVAKRFKSSDLDTSVLAEFTTNKPGRVHAKLIHSGDDSVTDEHLEDQPTVNHIFSFAKAVPGQPYYLVAAIFDPKSRTDVPTRTSSGTGDPRLQFTMPQTTSRPRISNLNRGQVTSSSMRFEFDIDSAAALQVTCFHVPNPDYPSQTEKISTPLAFNLDSFGLPSAETVSGHKEFSCDELESGETYIAQIEAVNDFGQPLQLPASVRAQTAAKLQFDGPVKVTLGSGGLTVAWKATVPGATGSITFEVPGQKPVSFPAQQDASSFSTTFSPDKLASAFPIDQNTKTIQAPPILTASMSDGSDKVERSFVVSVTVPGTKDSAQRETKVSNALADSLAKVADGIQNPSQKKFTWQDLVKTGIGILIKLI